MLRIGYCALEESYYHLQGNGAYKTPGSHATDTVRAEVIDTGCAHTHRTPSLGHSI